jgi:hypothetical protein
VGRAHQPITIERRNITMKKTLPVVIVSAALALSACGVSSVDAVDPAETTVESTVETTEDEVVIEDYEDEEEEPIVEDKGTFTNPFPFGTPLGNDDFVVTLGKVETKGVDALIKKANQFNDPAPKGTVYMRVPVTMTNSGTEKVNPAWDVDIVLVAPSGETYERAFVSSGSGGELKSLDDQNEMYPGGKAKGFVYFAAPKALAKDGMFEVSALFDDGVLIEAR